MPQPEPTPVGQLDWCELLTEYRSAASDNAGEEVLLRLAGGISWIARRHHRTNPVMDADDIQQQLALHVLEQAHAMKLPEDGRWIPRMLLERAGRCLLQELRRQDSPQTVPLDPELERRVVIEVPVELPHLILFSEHRVSKADQDLLYRHHVLGESLADIAADLGVTRGVAAQRLAKSRRRLRGQANTNSAHAGHPQNARSSHGRAVIVRHSPRQLRGSDAGVRRVPRRREQPDRQRGLTAEVEVDGS